MAVAVIVLALAGGGYSGVAVGAATMFVWLVVLVLLLSGRSRLDRAAPEAVRTAACLFALATLTAFSLIWARDRGAGFADVVRIGGYVGTFVLAALTLGPGRAKPALLALCGGILAVALVALVARLGGIGGGDSALVSQLSATSGRLSYPIGYWNALGALMALAVPLLVWLASERPGPQPHGVALAALCPPLLVAYMTSSRGALLAAVLGSVVVIAFARDRPKAAMAFAIAILASLPAICASTLMNGILDGPGTGVPGGSELVVATALIAGMGWAAWRGPRVAALLSRAWGRSRVKLRPIPVGIVVVVVGAGLVLLSSPSRLIDDFRSVPEQSRTESSGIITASGSGRAQFWGTALDAFADEPLKGIGAGGFATYWNIHGSLDTPTKNAHSEPLELLAELGPAGLAAFVAFFVIVVHAGVRRARGPGGPVAGAALGLITAASVGFLIDWTWQIPAVVVPVLIVASVLTGSAIEAPVRERVRTRRAADPVLAGWRRPAIVATLVVASVAALWAGGVLALSSSQLDASGRAFDRGEYGESAQLARSASAIEPWSAEPWLHLAAAEQGAGNLEAAQVAATEGIRLAPDDFRSWLLATFIQIDQKDRPAAFAYALRAALLAPQVLKRVAEVGVTQPGDGI